MDAQHSPILAAGSRLLALSIHSRVNGPCGFVTELAANLADTSVAGETEASMKVLIISVFAAVALFGTATLLSPTKTDASATRATISLQELYFATDIKKLPVQEIDDQSVIYSANR
jgi:hypothetical protein